VANGHWADWGWQWWTSRSLVGGRLGWQAGWTGLGRVQLGLCNGGGRSGKEKEKWDLGQIGSGLPTKMEKWFYWNYFVVGLNWFNGFWNSNQGLKFKSRDFEMQTKDNLDSNKGF
jgi:hypothetical protein